MSRELRGQLPGGMVHGFPGKSAYEIAVEQGFTGDIFEWLESLKGPDGISPHIGENENWFVGDIDTGNPSRGRVGPEGEPGFSPTVSMEAVSEGTRITVTDAEGEKTTVIHNGKQGESGYTPVKGTDYFDGITPHIGENGNWWIDETDTGLPSRGESIRGDTGKSAYEAAVEGGFSGTEAEFEAKMANTPTVQISMNTITQKASHSSGEILELVNGGLNVEASDSLSGNLFHLVRAAATKSVFERFRYTSDGKWLLETLEVDSNKTITVTNKYIEGLLPSGGTAGQLLKKVINGCQWADAPVGVPMSVGEVDQVLVKTGSGPSWCDRLPRGGIAGQILKKTEYGETWSDEVKELPDDGSAGQILESTGNGVRWTNLPSGLPDGGTPGQLLGKTENGEAWVDPPEGGTGTSVQPDWNQNDDTQVDFIKNRPFYDLTRDSVPFDGILDTNPAEGIGANSIIRAGCTYTVEINGKQYTAEGKALPAEMGLPEYVGYLGNGSFIEAGLFPDTGESYFIVFVEEGRVTAGVVMCLDPSTREPLPAPIALKVYGTERILEKVPDKFLPDAIQRIHILKHTALTEGEFSVQTINSAKFESAMADFLDGSGIVSIDGMLVSYVYQNSLTDIYTVKFAGHTGRIVHYSTSEDIAFYYADTDEMIDKSQDFIIPHNDLIPVGYSSDGRTLGSLQIDGTNGNIAFYLDGDRKYYYPITRYDDDSVGKSLVVKLNEANGETYLGWSDVLPPFTAADNGKVLGVVDGALAWVAK